MVEFEQNLKELLISESLRYPFMEVSDYVKFLYQNEFGCGHLISDPARSEAFLLEEYHSCLPRIKDGMAESVLAFPIGNGLCRFNLCHKAVTTDFLPLLNRFLEATANSMKGNMDSFQEKLGVLKALVKEGFLPVSGQALEDFLISYEQKGWPLVGHSKRYREHYFPHYRVIKESYVNFLPAFKMFRNAAGSGAVIAAIDGRCGSGKTFLAKLLSQIDSCPVLLMDHFFLPPAMRTKERLSMPGGNVDFERFEKEVLRPLSQGMDAVYQPFCCGSGTFLPAVTVPAGPLILVEGSYSMHPALMDYYNLRIFSTCSKDIQLERILKRSGPKLLERFTAEWIPMEELYFDTFRVEEACDLILDTSAF